MPALLALETVGVVIRRCLGRHGGATPGYAPLRPVPLLLVEKHVSHGGLHLVDAEGRVAVHHHLHVPVLVGESRDADVLEPPVGYLFSHLLDPDAEKTLLVEVVVWVLSRLHRRVHELFQRSMEKLVNTPMEPGQNPDDYFNKKRLLRIRIREDERKGIRPAVQGHLHHGLHR